MSLRYTGAWLQDGAFNPLVAPPPPTVLYNLYAWGAGRSGALGNGSTTDRSSPVQIGALTDWLVLAGGGYYAAGIKTNGTLWTWGRNSSGNLGHGNFTEYSSPKQVGALTNWATVTCSTFLLSTLAVKTDGTLWAWGNNDNGQLGLGNTTYRFSPVQVGALTNWLSVSASYGFTVATKTDGTAWSWGRGTSFGALGLGNTNSYSSPKQIGALTNWLRISTMYASCIALKTDGTMWSWGQNNFGSLGLSNTTAYSSPKQIGGLTTWSIIAASQGGASGYAIKTDGTLWSWGKNSNGQLGLGDATQKNSPNQIGALTNWSRVGATGGGAGAVRADGTMWTWGGAIYGQLGLGNTTYYSSPKQVGSLTTWLTINCGQYSMYARG
jgi:alpha-tubulin suppressor-like RCC1 family protein